MALSATEISAYLSRLAMDSPTRADLGALVQLQRAHLLHVPFENLDIHGGRPIVLEIPALFDKIVTRGRGGFCYELNGLFAQLLTGLGFTVTLLSAGVAKADGVFGPPFDHLLLRVDLVRSYIVDVGFGERVFRAARAPPRFRAIAKEQDVQTSLSRRLVRTAFTPRLSGLAS
jgi:N-hydroxyarylamine O-acetyltransferase